MDTFSGWVEVLLSRPRVDAFPLQVKHHRSVPDNAIKKPPTTTPIIVSKENVEAELDALLGPTGADGAAVGDGTGVD